ncbi:MAG: PTS sugar transporter subunit IIB [Treponema sp.]|nr:PTS sugar transporter subunit IIB [Treponema sp.]
MNITLLCNAGMSTSVLVEKLKEDGKAMGIDLDVDALPVETQDNRMEHTDILLLGPQVRYLLKKFQDRYNGKIPVIMVMNMSDYGLQNTKKILGDALALYNAKS